MDDFPLSLYVKCINLSTIMVCDILDEIICIAKISAVEWRILDYFRHFHSDSVKNCPSNWQIRNY